MARPETPSTSVATLGQLDVGVLQHLLDPVGHRGPLADQLGPLPRQVAQLADRRRRDEAGREQAVLEQLGDPLGVLDVGLAAGDLLDVLGVDQDHLEAALQEVEDRLPVDARSIPWRRGVTPSASSQSASASRSAVMVPKVRTCGADRAVGADAADAGDDGLLVDVQPGTAVMKDSIAVAP